jgi:hypothetical protein
MGEPLKKAEAQAARPAEMLIDVIRFKVAEEYSQQNSTRCTGYGRDDQPGMLIRLKAASDGTVRK